MHSRKKESQMWRHSYVGVTDTEWELGEVGEELENEGRGT